MHTITAVGLDIAKSVLQGRAIDDEGSVAVRWQVERGRVVPFCTALTVGSARDKCLSLMPAVDIGAEWHLE